MEKTPFGRYLDGTTAEIDNGTLNRHGLISGATGTGKTVTLKVLSERFSQQGIPVFVCDVKGDIASLIEESTKDEDIIARTERLHPPFFEFRTFSAEFYDVFGKKGLPMKVRISDLGPVLLSDILGLNDTQEGILNIVFRIADEASLLLYDLKDLRSMLMFIEENRKEIGKKYGNISTQSVQAILRSLLVLEEQGGDLFFGEPAFETEDLLRCNENGEGFINILQAENLFTKPKLYSAFLLWLLADLYEKLPEIGDRTRPKLMFFFDEAHLLYKNKNKALEEKIELIVRLIRSKGVGIVFITQNPTDLPDEITSQLGMKIQHGMRAFSKKDQKNVKNISESFRTDDSKKLYNDILSLKTGQAVCSVLQKDGTPSCAKICDIFPPMSKIGTVDPSSVLETINHSELYEKYTEPMDSRSAYEILEEKRQETSPKESYFGTLLNGNNDKSILDSGIDRLTKNILGQLGREIGRQISRNIFGTRKK